MKIKWKDTFEIEEDRNGFILSEWRISKDGKNKGERYLYDQVYPSTLESCLKNIAHRMKKNKDEVIDIERLTERMKEINDDFLAAIKDLKWEKPKEKKK